VATHTFIAGEQLTAANVNTYLNHTGSAWTGYTPTVAQSTSPTMTINRAGYWQSGRNVTVSVVATVASGTGVANNGIAVTIPVTSVTMPAGTPLGSGWILDLSAAIYYPCIATWVSTTTIGFFTTTTNTNVNAGQTGSAMSAALATGDVIAFTISYETATG
jgi:uncharacterized membrane protein